MTLPIAWTIAGSDSGGGAGIQADLHTFHALGIHGCSVITALTAQNTIKISGSHYATPASVTSQITALGSDLPPAAIKVGMLGKEGIIRAVARQLEGAECPVVVDPVMVSSTGTPLLDPHAMRVFTEGLLPLTDLLTPNLEELEKLTNTTIENMEQVEEAAAKLKPLGPKAILVKGGHAEGPECLDYLLDDLGGTWLSSPRIETTDNHGTGCVLSSAIAAGLALQLRLRDAVTLGKMVVNQGLRHSVDVGEGAGPLGLSSWPESPADLPTVFTEEELPGAFATFTPPEIPVYPIVDSADEVQRLLETGLKLVQIRLKTRPDADPGTEIARAIELGNQFDALVVINDDWQRALEHGARAVHLGQDDLDSADLKALQAAGMILGISTHGEYEIARAKLYQPSYIAIGTVFPTTSKVLDYQPLGRTRFRRLARLAEVPVVAIGGLTAENAKPILTTGAAACAVISDFKVQSSDPAARLQAWSALRQS